nr:hypothetical protein [Tanacetum cinerariifolium]
GVGHGREAQVGIVLAQQDAVLGAAREHAVRLLGAFVDEVIDEHADVRLVALEREGGLVVGALVGVDARHEALAGGF